MFTVKSAVDAQLFIYIYLYFYSIYEVTGKEVKLKSQHTHGRVVAHWEYKYKQTFNGINQAIYSFNHLILQRFIVNQVKKTNTYG